MADKKLSCLPPESSDQDLDDNPPPGDYMTKHSDMFKGLQWPLIFLFVTFIIYGIGKPLLPYLLSYLRR